jgi:hypothetical protein
MNQEVVRIIPPELLKNLYYEEKLSIGQIATRYDVSATCVYHLFPRYGFKPRTQKEAMVLFRKPLTKHRRARQRAIDFLGGRCAHCGCSDYRLLEIHHKKGGGGKDRHAVGGSNFIYSIVMGRRARDDLEICCKPCHAVEEVKRLYGVDQFHVEWRGL